MIPYALTHASILTNLRCLPERREGSGSCDDILCFAQDDSTNDPGIGVRSSSAWTFATIRFHIYKIFARQNKHHPIACAYLCNLSESVLKQATAIEAPQSSRTLERQLSESPSGSPNRCLFALAGANAVLRGRDDSDAIPRFVSFACLIFPCESSRFTIYASGSRK